MAINPVSLAEVLRPWRGAGVTHFLAEVFDGAQEQGEEQVHPQGASFSVSDETQATHTSQDGRIAAVADRDSHIPPASGKYEAEPPVPSIPASQAAGQQGGFSKHSAAPNMSRAVAAVSSPVSSSQHLQTAEFVEPSSWPDEWQAIFSRTSPAPLLWTYADLGADLTGRGSKERSSCLRTLIGTLNLPRGSSAFWPVSLHSDPAELFFFQAGLQLLAPKVVVMLGAEAVALTGLGLPLHQPFTQHIFQGRMYVLVPGFDALLSKSGLPDKACAFLRSAFSGLPTLFNS